MKKEHTCSYCSCTIDIRIAVECPLNNFRDLVCEDCYEEYFPEPDTGQPDFEDLEKIT